MKRNLFDCVAIFFIALIFSLAITGCTHAPPANTSATPTPVEVIVSQPVVKEVTDYEDFTGRTEAKPSVEIRARVTGYLDKVLFTEGTEVKKGDPLFQIDPRTYQAMLQQAEATLLQAEARLKRLELDYKRAEPLLPSQAISQEDFDKIAGDRNEAAAAVKMAEAARDLAKLNLEFTTVTAPINGRISRQLIDPGNMVQADMTPLTTIVSLDPMYAYFDVDERTTLRVRRLIRAGKVQSSREAKIPVYAALVDEEDFPHEGTIDFVDNRTDPLAGTLRIRGVFPNADRIFSPGMFVRVRVPIGKPHKAILINEQALGTDQGQYFVYVVNKNKDGEYVVENRPVKLGALQEGLRVVAEGLKPEETIVLKGLQRIKSGTKVVPKHEDNAKKEDQEKAKPKV